MRHYLHEFTFLILATIGFRIMLLPIVVQTYDLIFFRKQPVDDDFLICIGFGVPSFFIGLAYVLLWCMTAVCCYRKCRATHS